MKTLTLTSLVLLLASHATLAQEDPLAGFNDKEKARLEKGEVVVRSEVYTTASGKRAAKGKAYVVINKAPDTSFGTIQDYSKTPQFMPRLKRVTVLKKEAEAWKVRQDISVPFNTISYTLDLKFNPTVRRMEWTLDKTADNDIADTHGTWEFLPYGEGKTLVRYTIAVDSGRFVPKFLEDFLVKKDLPEVLLAVKRRTESGGTWKKD